MQGNEWEGPEEAFRRGYEHAAIETFHAVRRLLEPAAREILRTWVEDDINRKFLPLERRALSVSGGRSFHISFPDFDHVGLSHTERFGNYRAGGLATPLATASLIACRE